MVARPAALGGGAITDNASLVFSRSDAVTLNNAISGSGSVTQNGTGTLTLSGVDGYSGGTYLAAGQLNVNSNTALGTGAFWISSGSSATTIDNTSGAAVTLANWSTSRTASPLPLPTT